MKTMKNGIIIKGIIITIFLLIVPMVVMANGNIERPYGNLLDEEFTDISKQLEAEEIDLEAAINRLHEFRAENNREDNEDYQVMERLLTQLHAGEMTQIQAREQVQLLGECNEGLTPNQLKQRVRTMNQIRTQDDTQTGTQTQTQTQTQSQTSTETGTQSSTQEKAKSGQSGNGSTEKAKGKK